MTAAGVTSYVLSHVIPLRLRNVWKGQCGAPVRLVMADSLQNWAGGLDMTHWGPGLCGAGTGHHPVCPVCLRGGGPALGWFGSGVSQGAPAWVGDIAALGRKEPQADALGQEAPRPRSWGVLFTCGRLCRVCLWLRFADPQTGMACSVLSRAGEMALRQFLLLWGKKGQIV